MISYFTVKNKDNEIEIQNKEFFEKEEVKEIKEIKQVASVPLQDNYGQGTSNMYK